MPSSNQISGTLALLSELHLVRLTEMNMYVAQSHALRKSLALVEGIRQSFITHVYEANIVAAYVPAIRRTNRSLRQWDAETQ
jgi:hypothetical protein